MTSSCGPSTAPVDDLLEYLRGGWAVNREMTDAQGRRVGTFSGRATFHGGDSDVLTHEEVGATKAYGFEGTSRQARRYERCGAGARVYFGDGTFFHRLDLTTGLGTAAHACGNDMYRGSFIVFSENTWAATWDVTGPHKAHIVKSEYSRLRPP